MKEQPLLDYKMLYYRTRRNAGLIIIWFCLYSAAQVISQRWCGGAPRNLGWERPEQPTASGSWWPNTSLPGTRLARRTLKTTCCQPPHKVTSWPHVNGSQELPLGHFYKETREGTAEKEIKQAILGCLEGLFPLWETESHKSSVLICFHIIDEAAFMVLKLNEFKS